MKRIYWVIWALAFVVLEGIALFNDEPNDTLTGTITTHVPGWLLFMGIGWLGWHFIVSYLNEDDER